MSSAEASPAAVQALPGSGLCQSRKMQRSSGFVKLQRSVLIAAIAAVVASAPMYSHAATSAESSSYSDTASAEPFLGRWDLTLKAADQQSPTWLEIQQEDGQLKARMVGRWGNARPRMAL
jgi:hypothetical protein